MRVRAPEVPEVLAREVAEAVARLREMDVAKRPGVAETIDWSQALAFLGATRLEPEQAAATLGALRAFAPTAVIADDRIVDDAAWNDPTVTDGPADADERVESDATPVTR